MARVLLPMEVDCPPNACASGPMATAWVNPVACAVQPMATDCLPVALAILVAVSFEPITTDFSPDASALLPMAIAYNFEACAVSPTATAPIPFAPALKPMAIDCACVASVPAPTAMEYVPPARADLSALRPPPMAMEFAPEACEKRPTATELSVAALLLLPKAKAPMFLAEAAVPTATDCDVTAELL